MRDLGAEHGPVAALPMYDRPELRAETDRLWGALRDALRAEGCLAPHALTRPAEPRVVWRHPQLALAQTCGLPYVQDLRARVSLLGAPDYGLEGCPPGWYRSALVVRADDRREGLAAFRGADLAANSRCSQSGYAAVLAATAELTEDGRFFGSLHLTGSHAGSISAVACGRAEIAAIDAVTWRLARWFDRATAALRVLGWTEPTPGLPFIAGRDARVLPMRRALHAAIGSLEPHLREALGIRGFIPLQPADYAPLADGLRRAQQAHAVFVAEQLAPAAP